MGGIYSRKGRRFWDTDLYEPTGVRGYHQFSLSLDKQDQASKEDRASLVAKMQDLRHQIKWRKDSLDDSLFAIISDLNKAEDDGDTRTDLSSLEDVEAAIAELKQISSLNMDWESIENLFATYKELVLEYRSVTDQYNAILRAKVSELPNEELVKNLIDKYKAKQRRLASLKEIAERYERTYKTQLEDRLRPLSNVSEVYDMLQKFTEQLIESGIAFTMQAQSDGEPYISYGYGSGMTANNLCSIISNYLTFITESTSSTTPEEQIEQVRKSFEYCVIRERSEFFDMNHYPPREPQTYANKLSVRWMGTSQPWMAIRIVNELHKVLFTPSTKEA